MNEKSIKGFCLWLFWTVFYSVRPRERDFDKYMKRTIRTSWPWWKFKPNVSYNEDGRMWHVHLANESSYTAVRTIKVPVYISEETGKIVGLNLSNYILSEVTKPDGEG